MQLFKSCFLRDEFCLMITIDGAELDLLCFTGFRTLVGDLCFFWWITVTACLSGINTISKRSALLWEIDHLVERNKRV